MLKGRAVSQFMFTFQSWVIHESGNYSRAPLWDFSVLAGDKFDALGMATQLVSQMTGLLPAVDDEHLALFPGDGRMYVLPQWLGPQLTGVSLN